MTFSDLGLGPEILRAIDDAGYSEPTPIQTKAIPIALMGRDVLGCAQTGTGKTAGFTLPMIEILSQGRARARMPRSLIIAPTRELAAQVSESFDTYGKYHKLTKALLIGGTSFKDQEKALDRGVDVLIATPGRLIDLFERGKILLNDVKILVIDEADRMLDMGFIPDVERIVGLLPKIRQTLFFSATMAPPIRRLADAFLINPKEISVDPPASTATTVRHAMVMVSPRQKTEALRTLVEREDITQAIIFCNRKRDIAAVVRSLKQHNLPVAELHGDMHQSSRTETLEAFRNGDITLLVASDVAARGIDVTNISHVFNYDVPSKAEDYVHRIGRTGRAGREGAAYTLVTPEDSKYVDEITKLVGKAIERITLDGIQGPTAGSKDSGASTEDSGRSSGRPPRRGRRPARPARNEDRSASKESPKDAPKEAAKETQKPEQKTERKPEQKPSRQSQTGKGRTNEPVVGMGDHMPAFLVQPPPSDTKK